MKQSGIREAALKKAGVPVKLIVIKGGDHRPTFLDLPDDRPVTLT